MSPAPPTPSSAPHMSMIRGAIVIDGLMTVRLMETIATLPGKKRKIDGITYIQESQENVDHILSRHPEIGMVPYLAAKYRVSFDDDDNYDDSEPDLNEAFRRHKFVLPPFKHQMKDIKRFLGYPQYALFYEMGGGKTMVDLSISCILYRAGRIDTLLIIAPNGVHRQWIEKEVPKHVPDDIDHHAYTWYSGGGKERQRATEEALKFRGLLIIAVNQESLAHDSGKSIVRKVLRSRKKVKICYDESSGIKNANTARSKFVHEIAPRAVSRSILNGTPVSESAIDLFSQFKFLNPNILGDNYYAFRGRFCIMGGWEKKKIVGYRNLEDLQRVVDRYSSRVLKKDCLDLPPLITVDRLVELTDEQLELYESVSKDFIAELASGEIVEYTTAAARMNALQGILNGWMNTEDGVRFLSTERTQAVYDIVEGSGKKCIVWIKFHNDLKVLEPYLTKAGLGYTVYTGVQNSDEKAEALHQIRTNDKCRIIIASKAMDRGIDLPVTKKSIWYTPTYSADSYDQSNARPHRTGQDEPVDIVHITTGNRIDEKAFRAVRSKLNFATTLMDVRSAFL